MIPKKVFAVALLALIVLLLHSCSVVKKTIHKTTDESSIKTSVSVDTSKKSVVDITKAIVADSGHNSKQTEQHIRELNVDFDGPINTGNTASDYIDTPVGGVKVHTNGAANIVLKGNGDIEINGNPKSVRYTETGKSANIDSSHSKVTTNENTVATSEQKGTSTSEATATHKATVIDTSKTRFSFHWWWLLILLALLLLSKTVRGKLLGWWKLILLRLFGIK